MVITGRSAETSAAYTPAGSILSHHPSGRGTVAVIEPQNSSTQTDSTDGSDTYLAKRTLKKGTAGWVLLAGLGVSYVISGDYSGWNFGLDTNDPMDAVGHGTFVASLAAGAISDANGMSGFGGDAQLMIVQANHGGTAFSDAMT